MIGIMKFAFRDYVRTYRYIGPLLVYVLALLFIYSVVPNPVMPSYSLTASLLFAIATWLGFGYVDAEDATQQQIGMLHAGSPVKYYVCKLAVMLAAALILAAITTAYPIAFAKFDRQPALGEAMSAFVGHAGLAALGIVVSFLFTYRLVRKLSHAVVGLFLTVALSFASGGIGNALPDAIRFVVWLLPPVFPVMDAFNRYEEFSAFRIVIVLLAPWAYMSAIYVVFLRWMTSGKRR